MLIHRSLRTASVLLISWACAGESPTGTGGTPPPPPPPPPPTTVEADLSVVSGDGQSGRLLQALNDPIVVQVTNPSGDPVSDIMVRFSPANLDLKGAVTPDSVRTNSQGTATANWTLGSYRGGQSASLQRMVISATISGVSSVVVEATTPSLIPITDMASESYLGHPGGLYPGGNSMPTTHADAGRAVANLIEPLDGNGDPDAGGRVVLLAVGSVNAHRAFCGQTPCAPTSFGGIASTDPAVDWPSLAIVDGAEMALDVSALEAPTQGVYDRIRNGALGAQGVTEAQVQAVWLLARPAVLEPYSPLTRASDQVTRLGNTIRAMKVRYPNLKVVFVSSVTYSGYSVPFYSVREPEGYEDGFAVKWLVQAQIDQMANGGTVSDARAGDLDYGTVAPWIAWGPYLWADGSRGRDDGLTWTGLDFDGSLGGRYVVSGITKAGDALLDFFKTSPQAQCWFVAGGVC